MDLLKKYLLSSVARKPDDGAGAGAASGNGADAGGDAGKGTEGQQKQEQKEESGDFVTLAEDDDAIVVGEDGEDDDDADEDKGEGEGEPKEGEEGSKKRPSGSARLKARAARLERENAELRNRLQAPRRAPAAEADDSDLKEPKESDFPNDYLAYERALRGYETRKAIREENRRVAKEQSDDDADRAHRETVRAYNDRLETVKDRIPDFDDVMAESKGMQIRDDVLNQVLESSKGPLIAYHLAKNPDKVDALNRMSPLEAAREIGRLEARIRGPQSKKATSAKSPIRAPKGGTGGSDARPKDPDKMTMAEYEKARNSGELQ